MLLVKLAHHANPDIKGGYWPDANPDAPCGWVAGESLTDCALLCREYIMAHGLGGGNWIGGQIVMTRDGDDPNMATPGAFVSYNGRVRSVSGEFIV
jgi:hypothetical protein